MKKLEGTPSEIREELLISINEVRKYEELEKRGYLLGIYGVLEAMDGREREQHIKILQQDYPWDYQEH